ncbi:MAG: hypothetical protein EHM58_13435 [Ignavibacteriae bacterium]|nr:MAG: hypothetical protein EHM58_13435 [Ignavibacteriota bacterium]
MSRTFILFVFLITFFFVSCGKKQINTDQSIDSKLLNTKLNTVEYRTDNEEIISGLPEIGRWMFDSNLVLASWLGKKLDNKSIREPINIIIVDSISGSEDEAKKNLMRAFTDAGLKNRWGHTSGYKGLIDSVFCSQFPGKNFYAFSDKPFEFDNNHGRIFGPYFKNGFYYFTGALSRESGYYHNYISFIQARDEIAASLDERTNYKFTKKVWLDNAINNDSATTGDHDGYAILIEVTK